MRIITVCDNLFDIS